MCERDRLLRSPFGFSDNAEYRPWANMQKKIGDFKHLAKQQRNYGRCNKRQRDLKDSRLKRSSEAIYINECIVSIQQTRHTVIGSVSNCELCFIFGVSFNSRLFNSFSGPKLLFPVIFSGTGWESRKVARPNLWPNKLCYSMDRTEHFAI